MTNKLVLLNMRAEFPRLSTKSAPVNSPPPPNLTRATIVISAPNPGSRAITGHAFPRRTRGAVVC